MSNLLPPWDPQLYQRFASPRRRAALDLLARVDHPSPRVVHDIGCGTGDMARLMAEKWPEAEVTGSDLSPEMLARASHTSSRVRWQLVDLREWQPDRPIDVLYANAVLHWLDQHDGLFPRLAGYLAPGGVLAVQMPLSWGEPSHRLIREALARGGPGGAPIGSDALRARYDRRPVEEPRFYYELLRPVTASIEVWTTTYLQVLEGDDPVVEWVSGTALRPLLDELSDADRIRFLAAYRPAARLAYPPQPGGETLYPFPRLFIVARAR